MCDEPEELKRKVTELAAAVRSARHLVIYTGAGISTVGLGAAAGAPSGGSGVWVVAWFLNDHRTCVMSLGCCMSPAASTVSRLILGSFLLPRRSRGCIASDPMQDAQPEREDTGLTSLNSPQ